MKRNQEMFWHVFAIIASIILGIVTLATSLCLYFYVATNPEYDIVDTNYSQVE